MERNTASNSYVSASDICSGCSPHAGGQVWAGLGRDAAPSNSASREGG